MARTNEHGQPIGPSLGGWKSPSPPPARELVGRTVTLIPVEPSAHAPGLYQVLGPADDSLWTYMGFGPFETADDLEATLRSMASPDDWLPYTIFVDGEPLGFASYLRIHPGDGVIEIGAITFAPELQRTTPATEAIFLLIDNAFALGYRRVEWKCDDLNAPSRSAAVRLGFTYEGTFRQATHYKGRSRDTAWYSIIDAEWPALRETFARWLDPSNFDPSGVQRTSLHELREGK